MEQYKHVIIAENPIKPGYMVINTTFPDIPKYFGTLRQCRKAAAAADKNTTELLAAMKVLRKSERKKH